MQGQNYNKYNIKATLRLILMFNVSPELFLADQWDTNLEEIVLFHLPDFLCILESDR